MTSLSAAELASRVRRTTGHREATPALMLEALIDWERRGLAHQPLPGRWALTPTGRAMFEGWVGAALYPLEEAA